MWFFGKKRQNQQQEKDEKHIKPIINNILNSGKLYNVLEECQYKDLRPHFSKNQYKFLVTCSREHIYKWIPAQYGLYFYKDYFWNEVKLDADEYKRIFIRPVKWRFKERLIMTSEKYYELLYEEQIIFREMFYDSFKLMEEIMRQPEVADENYRSLVELCDEMLTFLKDRKLLTAKKFNDKIKQEIEDARRIKNNMMLIE